MPRYTRTVLSSAVALAMSSTTAVAQQNDQLDNIVVSASGFEQAMVDAPASISVVSREELQRKRVTSIADALRDVEGVDVGGQVGKTGGRNISIRGMPSDYTLILIDGRRQNTAGSVTPNGFGETSTSFFPPVSSIERIEVIRGPMSTLYGSDAMGGVINIITRKVDREWTGSIGVENTFNEDRDFGDRREINLYISGPMVEDTLGIQLRGRFYERDASELQYSDQNGDPIEVSQRGPSPVEGDTYNLGGKLTWTPTADHDLWLDGEVNRQRYNNDDSQLGTLDNPQQNSISGYSDELRFEREQVAIGHTGRFALGTLESSLMRNMTTTEGRTIPDVTETDGDGNVTDYYGFNEPHPTLPSNPLIGSKRELETTNTVLDSKFTMPLGDHMTTLGVQWWEAELDDGLAGETFEQTTSSVFAEDEWLLRDDLALTLGGRYDHHDAFGSQFSPRGYLVWNTTPNWTLKGGVSRGYKTPSLNDLHDGINGVTGQGTILTIGNPDLEPETSTSSEVGAHYDNQQGFTASATLFHNQFDDKIASGNDIQVTNDPLIPDGVYSQQVNVDEAITQGVELATSYQFTPDWRLSANYTYTDSEQKSGENEGDPLTDTPEHAVNATLRWQATAKLDAWLSAEYRSERYRNRERVRGAPSFDDLGDFKAYSLFNLGGNYAVTEQLNLSATIYNLFDKDFVDYQSYASTDRAGNPQTSYGNRYANSEEGRRLWLSVRYAF